MEEKTKILVCLAASTATNCQPCFAHYHQKAEEVGLTEAEIKEAVNLAGQVKKGAHMAITNHIQTLMAQEKKYDLPCDREVRNTCCG